MARILSEFEAFDRAMLAAGEMFPNLPADPPMSEEHRRARLAEQAMAVPLFMRELLLAGVYAVYCDQSDLKSQVPVDQREDRALAAGLRALRAKKELQRVADERQAAFADDFYELTMGTEVAHG